MTWYESSRAVHAMPGAPGHKCVPASTASITVNRNIKLAMAGGVLGLGLLAAFLFRKPPTSLDVGTGASPRRAEPGARFGRESGGAALAVPTRAVPLGTPSHTSQGSARTGTLVVPRGGVLPRADQQPPDLAPSFDSVRSPLAESRMHRTENAPSLQNIGAVKPQRIHKIVDGDSLEKLAEQYLGSSARAGEIFALNGDVLQAPDLLPIGRVLKIPPHEPVTPSRVRDVADSLDLVPIPPGAFK
jgi:hypothetical protein